MRRGEVRCGACVSRVNAPIGPIDDFARPDVARERCECSRSVPRSFARMGTGRTWAPALKTAPPSRLYQRVRPPLTTAADLPRTCTVCRAGGPKTSYGRTLCVAGRVFAARRPSTRDLCRAFCMRRRSSSSLPRSLCNRRRDFFVLSRSVFAHHPALRLPNRTDRVLHRAFCARRSSSCSRLDVIFVLPTASSCPTTDFSSPRTARRVRKRDLSFTQRTAFLTFRTLRALRLTVFRRLPHFFHRSSSNSERRPALRFHFRLRADWQRTFCQRRRTFSCRRRPGRSRRHASRCWRTRFSVL